MINRTCLNPNIYRNYHTYRTSFPILDFLFCENLKSSSSSPKFQKFGHKIYSFKSEFVKKMNETNVII
jgi:hypothetical protein